QRNLISGFNYGVHLRRSADNVVAGNLIGTDATGTKALGNWAGVATLEGSTGDRSGVAPSTPYQTDKADVLSAMTWGVSLGAGGTGETSEAGELGAASGTEVYGNLIGTDATGQHSLGTLFAGVGVGFGSHDVSIGGDLAPALANTIAFNG